MGSTGEEAQKNWRKESQHSALHYRLAVARASMEADYNSATWSHPLPAKSWIDLEWSHEQGLLFSCYPVLRNRPGWLQQSSRTNPHPDQFDPAVPPTTRSRPADHEMTWDPVEKTFHISIEPWSGTWPWRMLLDGEEIPMEGGIDFAVNPARG